jgi:acyl dehydratase
MEGKMAQMKYGNDFTTGEIYKTAAITMTETHVVTWAGLTMDFYPLHMDKEYAAKSQFGERLVHGPLIFAMAVGLVGSDGFAGDAAIAWLGVDNMKMYAPVKIGDTIHVEVEIMDQRETKNPKQGIQTWKYTVKNQRDETVMDLDYKMMFHQRV